MTEFYAIARSIDPQTADVVFDATTSGWAHQHPTAQLVATVLRTPKGSAKRDPGFGTDYSQLDVQRRNAPALAEQAVRNALAPYVARGRFRVVGVEVDVLGKALLLRVTVQDPRDRSTHTVPHRITA